VGCTDDIFEALDMQDELQTLYTSGTVFHAFLGEKLPTGRPPPNWCEDCGQLQAALLHHFPHLFHLPGARLYRRRAVHLPRLRQAKTEVYSRITGYYRPVQNWNDGKLQEFKQRKVYAAGASFANTQKVAAPAPKAAKNGASSSLRRCENSGPGGSRCQPERRQPDAALHHPHLS
jgi:ribonucleoside-triphosphate reductase